MIAPRIALLVAALALTASVDLLGQQEPPVAPGDRVRVTARTIDPDRLVGTLVAVGADTFVLEVEGRAEPLALPLASVTRLEVHTGRKSRTLLGAGIGFGVGAGFGVAILIDLCNPEETCDVGDVAKAVGVLGGIGAGLGALIGSAIKVDRWDTVPLDRLRVSSVPHGADGLVVSVSVAF